MHSGESLNTAERWFRVFLEIKPGVLIADPYRIVLPQGDIYLEEIRDSATERPIGLKIVATLSSKSLDDAIPPAKGLTRGILSLFSYITNAGLPEPVVMKAYEITPGATVTHLRQYHYDIPIETSSIRVVNRNLLKNALNEYNMEKHSLRISRALHWYRIGILSDDVLDRYVALWTGLETLNIILVELYNLEKEMSKCPDCGRETVPIQNGIRELVNDLFSDEERKIWRRLRETRASIVHGFRTFAEITPEARKLLPYLEKSIEKALDDILHLKGIKRKSSIQLDHPHPIYSQVDVTISGPDINLLDESVEPSFDANFSLEHMDSKGQTFRTTRSQSLDERFTVKEIRHTFHTMEHAANRVEFNIDLN